MFPSARIRGRGGNAESESEADEFNNEDDEQPSQVKRISTLSRADTKDKQTPSKPTIAGSSTEQNRSHFQALKHEFNSLMADLMKQAVESPDQSPMRRVRGGGDATSLDYSSMFNRRLNAIHDAPPPIPHFLRKQAETSEHHSNEEVLNDSLDIPPPPNTEEYNWEKAWQEEDASEMNLDYAPPRDFWPSCDEDAPPPPRSTESPLNITPNASRHRGISFDSPPAPRISLCTSPSRRSEKEMLSNEVSSPMAHTRPLASSTDRSSVTVDALSPPPNSSAPVKHVNDSLLRTLHEERREKEELLDTVKRLEADLEEQKAQFEVERETYRVLLYIHFPFV